MLADLMAVCNKCKMQTERNIDTYIAELKTLGSEIEDWRKSQDMSFATVEEADKRIKELQSENERLKSQSTGLTYDQQYLFDICGQMAEAWRYKFDSLAPGVQAIIKAWDKVNSGQSD